MPLSRYAAVTALDALIPSDAALTVVLLSSSPADSADGTGALASAVPLSALSVDTWPTCAAWTAADATALKSNAAAVSFGTVEAPFSASAVALLDTSLRLVAWAPLVDAAGVHVTRSFSVGDTIALPIGALSVALS